MLFELVSSTNLRKQEYQDEKQTIQTKIQEKWDSVQDEFPSKVQKLQRHHNSIQNLSEDQLFYFQSIESLEFIIYSSLKNSRIFRE